MTVEELSQLLEVYTLEEICQAVDLEAIDILVILEDQGYLANLELTVPL